MTRHLIDELVFDIAIDSRNRTMQDDAYLSRLVTSTLLPVVEEVFDGFDDGDAVLVLPSLEIDLGNIDESDYEDTAVTRLRAALDDALHRALADARQARGAGGVAHSVAHSADRGDVAPTIVSYRESELAQLARFLDTGTMPWHADICHVRLHEALLDRLLAHGSAELWTVLARALADPRSARRLIGQFPEHQLLAVLRGSAGARAGQFEALLAELKRRQPGANLPDAAWVQVLAACTANKEVDVQTACARIRTALAPSAADAHASSRADIDLLAHFLDSGVLRLAHNDSDQLAHEALLDRLLNHGGESLRAVLARALANPHSARRLVEQFPERQLLEVMRCTAGAGARHFEEVLAEAKQWAGSADKAGLLEQAWLQVLAACTNQADIDARASCARIRAVLAPSVAAAGAPSLSDMDALAEFLDSGVLRLAADGSDQPAHQALLDRLLKNALSALSVDVPATRCIVVPAEAGTHAEAPEPHQVNQSCSASLSMDSRLRGNDGSTLNADSALRNCGDDLWAVLARALAHPRSARRFVEQFPERQLLAVLRRMAGARAAQFESLLEEATQWPSGGAEGTPAAVWVRVLAACTGAADAVDAEAACSRIRAALGRSMAQADLAADIASLAEFLDSGQLRSGPGDAVGQPAHEALLDRLLAHGAASLWPVLSRTLADPRSASRLVEQFPERQLLAVLRQAAPTDAVQFEALLAETRQWTGGTPTMSMAWRLVLAECGVRPMPGGGVQLALSRIRSALAPYWSKGEHLGSTTAHRVPAGRTLDPGGRVLTNLPSRSAAVSVGAPRFAQRFSGNSLLSLLRQAAPVESARRLAVPAAAGAGATTTTTWRRLRAASRKTSLAPTKNGAATTPVPSLPHGTHALLGLLTGFLAGAKLPLAPDRVPGVPVHEALLERLLAQGGGAVWSALARALASPACARRLVEHFPQHQVRALMQRLAPAQAMQLGSLLTQINRNPTSVNSTSGHAAHEALPARVADQVAPLAPLQDDTPARADEEPRASDDAIERTSGQGAQSYRLQLRHLKQFLETGLLPHAAVGTDERHLHEALLDDVIARADDALWLIVAHALEQVDSAGRLLAQFPQRQLIALSSKSAPGYAPALERLVQRLSAMQGDRSGAEAGDGRQAQVCRRHVLAACVARPAIKALPALIYAKVAQELNGRAAPGAQTSYARRLNAHPVDATMPWRASQAERRASLALVRLAGMIEQFRPLIDDSGESTSAPVEAPIVAASDLGLVLRQREQMARWLHDECRALEALLLGETARPDARGAASFDDVSTLRTTVAAQVSANAAIAPQRRELMLESIDAKLAEAADPAHFLRGVLAVVMTGAPLDLDALLAHGSAVAAAPETPTHMLAAALKAGDAAAVFAHWQALLRSHGPQIRAGLRHYGRSAPVRHALAQALPDAIFIDLVGLLDGGTAAILRELLTRSAPLQDAVGRGAAWTEWTIRCRLHALTTLIGAAAGERPMEASAFLRGVAPADSKHHAELLSALPAQFEVASRPAAHLEPTSAPAPQPRAATTVAQQQPAPVSRVRDAAAPVFPEPVDTTELLVVGNAGMVLAGPYLPRLFAALGLTVDGKFIDEDAAGRAVHLVQYMVTGDSHSPEYQLVLNKILCGLPTATPVPAGIDITQTEQDTIEGMVKAMVAHAKVLGNCSVAAMRQTFFARKADLQLIDDAWQLRVHPGTFDMLLDRLPWAYSIIKFGWMARPLHVEWRPK